VNYLHTDKSEKDLIFTKEISGRIHEGNVKVHQSLKIDVGHASHSFINDQLNYRVDIKSPIIVLSENLSQKEIDGMLNLLDHNQKPVLFITKKTPKAIEDYLIAKNAKTSRDISLMNLSESQKNSDEVYKTLVEKLKTVDDVSFGPLQVKKADRVILLSATTYFIDSKFQNSKETKGHEIFKKLVDIHLRSPNEAWIHQFKNDIGDAYINLQESLTHGILPSIKDSFFLANKELKTYYSENSEIQRGIEVVQNAIDSTVLEKKEEISSSSETSFEDHLKESIEEGTFIPASQTTKIVGDVVTICNFLLQTNQN